MKLIWCNGFPEIYAQLEGVQLTEVYDQWSIGGVGGVNLSWIYVHSAIYETYVV